MSDNFIFEQLKCIPDNNVPATSPPKPRGGYRPNSGRKKTLPDGTRRCCFEITDDERVMVKKLIKYMRNSSE